MEVELYYTKGPKGARGPMGWSGNDDDVIIELTKQWNILADEEGYLYTHDDRPMSRHLALLNEAINEIRKSRQK